ncbi:MAG: hypothetical protein Ta2G_00340 [Termitinemataceae bacterium]|nr:MAG: hypothetical protein Ta2G_00340 [Termitinemataceae bacterium]
MKFDHGGMFSFLAAIIPFIIFSVVHFIRKFPVVCRLTNPLQNNLSDKRRGRFSRSKIVKRNLLAIEKELRLRYIFSVFFFLLFYVFVIIALSGPRHGRQIVQELQRGADVVFAFDVSLSMNVRDAPEIEGSGLSASRLERSLWIVKKIMESSYSNAYRNVRFGIAFGKGEAVLAIPLTDDKEAIWALLGALNDLAMTSRGTNLEKLLDASLTAFKDEYPSARHVVLFTDGESLQGSFNAALERLNVKNVTTIGVGSGSIYGAPLSEAKINFINDGTQVQKKRSKPIISYLKADVLSSSLQRNGGIYIDGNRDEAAMQILGNIKTQGPNTTWVSRETEGEKAHIFILAALLCLLFSVLCTVRLK